MTDPTPEGGWPIEGTVTRESENVTGWEFPCGTVWIEHHDNGDVKARIRNDLRANHPVGTEVDVRIRRSGQYEFTEVREPDAAAEA